MNLRNDAQWLSAYHIFQMQNDDWYEIYVRASEK